MDNIASFSTLKYSIPFLPHPSAMKGQLPANQEKQTMVFVKPGNKYFHIYFHIPMVILIAIMWDTAELILNCTAFYGLQSALIYISLFDFFQ